jgi:hypothetical protein
LSVHDSLPHLKHGAQPQDGSQQQATNDSDGAEDK